MLQLSCGGSAEDSSSQPLEEDIQAESGAPILLRSLGNESSFGSVVGAVSTSDGRVAVLDGLQHSVALADDVGVVVHRAGSRGRGPGEMMVGSDIELAPNGDVMLLDQGNNRITRYKIVSDTLALISSAQLFKPASAMCVAADRTFVLTDFEGSLIHEVDSQSNRVRSFGASPEDELEAALLAQGAFGCSEARIAIASATTGQLRIYDTSGELLHADTIPGFVRTVYERSGASVRPQPPARGYAHESSAVFWLPHSSLVVQFARIGVGEERPLASGRLSWDFQWTDGPLWPRFLSWDGPTALMAVPQIYPAVGAYRIP